MDTVKLCSLCSLSQYIFRLATDSSPARGSCIRYCTDHSSTQTCLQHACRRLLPSLNIFTWQSEYRRRSVSLPDDEDDRVRDMRRTSLRAAEGLRANSSVSTSTRAALSSMPLGSAPNLHWRVNRRPSTHIRQARSCAIVSAGSCCSTSGREPSEMGRVMSIAGRRIESRNGLHTAVCDFETQHPQCALLLLQWVLNICTVPVV